MRVQFHGLLFDLPPEWTDITDDLPEGSPPTLARPSGLGIIQFSIARYRSGANPEVTVESLRELIADFCSHHSLNAGGLEETIGRIPSVGCVIAATDELVAAWYLSNGQDIVLVNYISSGSGDPDTAEELGQARQLVATIDFDSGCSNDRVRESR
jgi:hypothetical protein